MGVLCRALLPGLLALLVAGEAVAAALGVAPTRIELAPGQTSASLTIENQANAAVTLQVQTFAWSGPAIDPELRSGRELIAVPPVFSLEPGAKQIVRVALRTPVDGQRERAYRLLITEVPVTWADDTMGVRFALRLSLPVFAKAAGAKAAPAWSIRSTGRGGELELANRGTAHLRLRRIELRTAGKGGDPVQVIDAPMDILPGEAQRWPLTAAAMALPSLELQADTGLGPLTAELVPPPR